MIVIVVRANSALSFLAAALLPLEKGLPVNTTTILRF
jgi:hypothetical protein